MYRTVNTESVIQFASNKMSGKLVGIKKSEAVVYTNGTLQSSYGTVTITVNGPVQPSPLYGESISDELPTYDESFGTSELSGSGQYSLKLEKCYPKPSVVRRSVKDDEELTESSIFAQPDDGSHHILYKYPLLYFNRSSQSPFVPPSALTTPHTCKPTLTLH